MGPVVMMAMVLLAVQRLATLTSAAILVRNRLAEPNDKRTKLSTVAGFISQLHFVLIRFQFLYVCLLYTSRLVRSNGTLQFHIAEHWLGREELYIDPAVSAAKVKLELSLIHI